MGIEELLEEVWGYHHRVRSRAVTVLVSRLRKRLEADPAEPRALLTERGKGYRLVVLAGSPSSLAARARELRAQLHGPDPGPAAREIRARWPDYLAALPGATPEESAELLLARAVCAGRDYATLEADELLEAADAVDDVELASLLAAAAVQRIWRSGSPGAATSAAETWLTRLRPRATAQRAHQAALLELEFERISVLTVCSRHDEALPIAMDALERSEQLGSRRMTGALLERIAHARERLGQPADVWWSEAERQLARAGSAFASARLAHNRALRAFRSGRVGVAGRTLTELAGTFEALGAPAQAARTAVNAAIVQIHGGELADARALIADHLPRQEAALVHRDAVLARLALALCAVVEGDAVGASAELEVAAHLAVRGSLTREGAQVARYQGWCAQRVGDPDAARACYARSLEGQPTGAVRDRAVVAAWDALAQGVAPSFEGFVEGWQTGPVPAGPWFVDIHATRWLVGA